MPDGLKDGLAVGAAVVLALLLKLPLLYSADALYTSDEANAGLLIKQLLDRGELTTHIWGTSYSGTLEQLLAVPFVTLLGFSALPFKLAPTILFCLWIAVTYRLGRCLGGRALGLTAALLLAGSPPVMVFWTQDFGGALTVTHLLGAIAVYLLARSLRPPLPNRRVPVALAFVIGLGLYANTLFVVYLVPLGLHFLLRARWWADLRSGRVPTEVAMRPAAAAACTIAFLLGFAPRLYHLLWGPANIYTPHYQVASPARLLSNLRLLVKSCLPSLLGFNPFRDPEVARWTGDPTGSPLFHPWGWVVLAILTLACLTAVLAYRRELLDALRLRPTVLPVPATLAVLIVFVPAAFVLSTHPANIHSNHYLIPLYVGLPLVVATGLQRWRRIGRPVPLCATMLVLAFYVGENFRNGVHWELITPAGRLQRLSDPWQPLVAYLDRHGIRGAYGSYWLAYRTVFASAERAIVAPYPYSTNWDRYPRYTAYVSGLADPAYLFFDHEAEERAALERLLERRGLRYVERTVGRFVVVHSDANARFYNYLAEPPPAPLPASALRPVFVETDVPSSVRAGETVTVSVTVRNAGDRSWPARPYYLDARYQVRLAYHWLDGQGRIVIYEGHRTALGDDLGPGDDLRVPMKVVTPSRAGRYRLALALVQEAVGWYGDSGGKLAAWEVEVRN